ncbi:MAG: WD40 repeat domain-containing protein, partial [Planctomycetota bacterium]|nr:WD40 repeat domain-containing protein [Planctomycetota bacterium]
HTARPSTSGVAMRPDGTTLVAGFDARGVWVTNADGTGEPVIFEDEGFGMTSLALNAEGTQVLVGLHEGGARLLPLDSASDRVTLEGPLARFAISSVAFSPDDDYMLMASADTARVWRSPGRGEPIVFANHEDLINTAVFSPDGSHVVTTSDDGTARVWRSRDGEEIALLAGHGSRVVAALFSPDGRRVVTVSADNTARIWPVDGTGALVGERWESLWEAGEAFLRGKLRVDVFAEPDSRIRSRVMAGLGGGNVRLGLQEADGSRLPLGVQVEGLTTSSDLRGVTMSSEGRYLLYTLADGRVLIQPADEQGSSPRLLGRHDARVNDGTFSPDSSLALTASDDGTAILWRTDGSGTAASLQHDEGVLAARFSGDGRRVLTVSSDRTMRVWSADGTGGPIVLSGLASRARAVALSTDGTRVVTVGADDTAEVWDVDGDGAPRILRGHEDALLSVSFSPDDRYVVSAARDETVRVWRIDGTEPPLVLRPDPAPGATFFPGMSSAWFSAAFSRDGSSVITLTNEGAVRLWPITWRGLMTTLRDRTNACLLVEQRMRYLAEGPDEARSRYAACESGLGRGAGG